MTIWSVGTSSPVCSDTRRYRMRELVLSSSWLNRTSRDFVAETSFTGTVTSPKLIVPVQIALGTTAHLLLHSRTPDRPSPVGPGSGVLSD